MRFSSGQKVQDGLVRELVDDLTEVDVSKKVFGLELVERDQICSFLKSAWVIEALFEP